MISIIIPTYNDSSWMMPGLTSCLKQSMEVEIIIVDDQSTIPIVDEVLKFIREHPCCRMVKTDKLPHEKNPAKNLANARNIGIQYAKYDYILPLDADDYLFDNVLPKMLKVIQTENADIVCGNICLNGSPKIPLFSHTELHTILSIENPLFVTSLIRKSIWKRVGGYPLSDMGYYEDWAFWCKCVRNNAKVRYIPINVYFYTIRQGISSIPRDHTQFRNNTLVVGGW